MLYFVQQDRNPWIISHFLVSSPSGLEKQVSVPARNQNIRTCRILSHETQSSLLAAFPFGGLKSVMRGGGWKERNGTHTNICIDRLGSYHKPCAPQCLFIIRYKKKPGRNKRNIWDLFNVCALMPYNSGCLYFSRLC